MDILIMTLSWSESFLKFYLPETKLHGIEKYYSYNVA